MTSQEPNHSLDLCDLTLVYNGSFQYCVPKEVVKTFLEGNSFGRKKLYSFDEQKRLKDDINTIYETIVRDNPLREKLAVITAGSPGAGKTILMRRYLKEEKERGRKFTYVDPDDVCLRMMEKTWASELDEVLKQIEEKVGEEKLIAEKKVRQDAYDKWRPGSNAAAHLILAHLIRQHYAFYFGSTSSSPHTAGSFKFLKKQEYKIHLIHISAPDKVRWDSVRERDKSFVQTTEEDIREKGKLVPERINDTYLKYADQIDFYYREGLERQAVLTAVWLRGRGQDSKGELTIYDNKKYKEMVNLHNSICSDLKREDILWENSLLKVAKID